MLGLKAREAIRVNLKPAPSALVLIGFLVGFGPALCIVSFYYKVSQVYGLVLLFGAMLIWLSVATIRVKLFSDHLERKIFWHTSWRVNLADASLREGRGGDLPFIPAIIVSDRQTGRKIGEILKPQFKVRDLLVLKEALASLGVEIESPPRRKK